MRAFELNSIDVCYPPKHTKICIKCDKCSKREVCNIQKDYRKVVTLMEKILGNPQLDREIVFCDNGFTGFEFSSDFLQQMPKTYKLVSKKEEEKLEGEFLNARFTSKNTIKVLLKVNDYYVMFKFNYDSGFDKYNVEVGRELIYGIIFELEQESVDSIQDLFLNWRKEMVKQEEERKNMDIINTTAFYATLDCKYFEEIKKNSIHNPNKFVNHNCDNKDKNYHHVATYHAEPAPVEEAQDCERPPIGFYPWFIPMPPPPCKKRPPIKRKDQ